MIMEQETALMKSFRPWLPDCSERKDEKEGGLGVIAVGTRTAISGTIESGLKSLVKDTTRDLPRIGRRPKR
jgi:hypothetical protein